MDIRNFELWVGKETRTREGVTCLTTMRKKRRKKDNVVLHCTGTSSLGSGGYENIEKKNKDIKENEMERSWIASTDVHWLLPSSSSTKATRRKRGAEERLRESASFARKR
jgi:hypothetical protein